MVGRGGDGCSGGLFEKQDLAGLRVVACAVPLRQSPSHFVRGTDGLGLAVPLFRRPIFVIFYIDTISIPLHQRNLI